LDVFPFVGAQQVLRTRLFVGIDVSDSGWSPDTAKISQPALDRPLGGDLTMAIGTGADREPKTRSGTIL